MLFILVRKIKNDNLDNHSILFILTFLWSFLSASCVSNLITVSFASSLSSAICVLQVWGSSLIPCNYYEETVNVAIGRTILEYINKKPFDKDLFNLNLTLSKQKTIKGSQYNKGNLLFHLKGTHNAYSFELLKNRKRMWGI